MFSFFRDLFRSQDFMPHGYCFLWFPDVVWSHVISDVVIALAYFSIPTTISYLIFKRKSLPFKWVYAFFAAFILLCGLSHVMSAVTLWIPLYRLHAVIKVLTAAVSICTAILILPIVPKMLELFEQLQSNDPENEPDQPQKP